MLVHFKALQKQIVNVLPLKNIPVQVYQLGVRKIKVHMKHKQVHENDKVGNNTFHSRLQQLRILQSEEYWKLFGTQKHSIINFQANHDISEYPLLQIHISLTDMFE